MFHMLGYIISLRILTERSSNNKIELILRIKDQNWHN